MTLRTKDAATPANISPIDNSDTSSRCRDTPTGILIADITLTTITVNVLDVPGNFPGLNLDASAIQVSATDDQGLETLSDPQQSTVISVRKLETEHAVRSESPRVQSRGTTDAVVGIDQHDDAEAPRLASITTPIHAAECISGQHRRSVPRSWRV